MGMKSTIGMLGMLAMFAHLSAMGNDEYLERSDYIELTDEEKAELKKIFDNKMIELMKKKGVNEYFYGKNVVYARNKKNADRKARNKKYL